jgi:hypothetical protein
VSALPLHFDLEYRTLLEGKHLALAIEQEMRVFRSDGWITNATLDTVPGEVLVESSAAKSKQGQRLVRVGDALVYFWLQELSLTFRVAAKDAETCEAAIDVVKCALPVDRGKEDEVPIRFWWWNLHSAQEMAKRTPAPEWGAVSTNYSEATLCSLAPLADWERPPSAGGRLMLWHGAPGTGKTTAIRALARQWRSWAEFQFVTDPERFLSNPGYLLEVATDESMSRDPDEPRAEWRVLVLEDAGEYLSTDAKQLAGQGLSRLLNLCDGVLGQATNSLVLVTTNEPLRTLHPALSRPGRCVAEAEFLELDRPEIERWCRLNEVAPPLLDRASLADLFAHADGRLSSPPSPAFGFAAA